ncbi:MAG: DUF6011 domain-containing protein [Planctomycetota bacterium]|jgi:hypothetical protein
MNASKVNQKSSHQVAEFDPFAALERMPGGKMKPRTPFPGRDGIPFDAEVLYARKAAANNRHPELDRLETKFNKTIIGFLFRDSRGRAHLQCDTEGHKSVLQCDVSFKALLTLPNLRQPCKVKPVPDTTIFEVFDNPQKPQKPGYIVDRVKETCGCQLLFNHSYDCRHLQAVREWTSEHNVEFIQKRPSDYPEVSVATKSEDWLDKLVKKHHPDAVCAPPVVTKCSICGRELTDPESIKCGIGPECLQKTNGKADDGVSPELFRASQLWNNERFQKWILKGVLTLGAPLPKTVLTQATRNGETSYWGYSKSPYLYYLAEDDTLHCIYTSVRKLKYKAIPPCANELDAMALRAASNLLEDMKQNGWDKKVRTILI